jgi:hypothetical protein
MHPLGFAYYADGAHKDTEELEPGVNPYENDCVDNLSCQYPRYYGGVDGNTYLGSDPISSTQDWGLDVYEPNFQLSRAEWYDFGYLWNVRVNITDPNTNDFFYFCHVHNNMSGRIKVLDANGNVRSVTDDPALGYNYQTISDLDAACGTYNVEAYFNTEELCPDMEFLCNVEASSQKSFGKCMVAIDCAMHVGMRSNIQDNEIATFMQQMIPHHENAVNMAKIILKQNVLGTTTDPDREIEDMMWSIINGQNAQITFMRKWLNDNAYSYPDRCDYESEAIIVKSSDNDDKIGTNIILSSVTLGLIGLLFIVTTIALVAFKMFNERNSTSDKGLYKTAINTQGDSLHIGVL